MRAVTETINAGVLRRYAETTVGQINDARYPIKFRYHAGRATGSYFLVTHVDGRQDWRKLGEWPALMPRELFAKLPEIMAAKAAGDDSAGVVSRFDRVGELLEWYRERTEKTRTIKKDRRSAIKSVINKHLLPALGDLMIDAVNHDEIDGALFLPMQAEYSLAYCQQVFGVLREAFKRAHKLRLIKINTMGAIVFSDFVKAAIKPRDGRLRAPDLLRLVGAINAARPEAQILALLMLLHGTRIGETRQMRWRDIDIPGRTLTIPAENAKTAEALRLPITEVAVAMLNGWRKWQAFKGYTGDFVLPNRRGACIGRTRANRLMHAVGGGAFTAHDLRKFARSAWADLGVDYMVGERLLNHKLSGLDQAYIHTHVEAGKREALKKYHHWLIEKGLRLLDTEFYGA